MKRVLAAFIAFSLTLLAYPLSPAEAKTKLQNAMNIQTAASEFGDITITWDPTPLQSLTNVDLRIGYSYDLPDEPMTLRPRRFDPSAGTTVFSNLSLDSAYKFNIQVRSNATLIASKQIIVSTPKPSRQLAGNASINRQLSYIDARWRTRENPQYAYVPKNDCANFVSQTLVARGLKQNKIWHEYKKKATLPFVRATYLKAYLLSLPGFEELSDDQRDQVKLGDLAMFDWDNSGDTDHVGIVNRIQTMPDGSTRLFIAQHTLHRYYRSVDWFITVRHPNAKVIYLSVPENLTY